jgi:hypothetical protein
MSASGRLHQARPSGSASATDTPPGSATGAEPSVLMEPPMRQ